VLALAVVAGFACGGDDGGADFELSGLTISPSEAGVDEDVSIQVTVENVGDDEGSTEVTLKVDGDEVDSEDVTVAAGATRTVTFTHSESAAGTYAIKVDGESGTLTVTAGPGPSPTPPPDGEGPGVGSTWEYVVDYVGGPFTDETDHPWTTTLVEKGVAPKSDFVCVTADATVSCDLYQIDTHADGACPPNPTLPKRPMAGFTIVPIGVSSWQDGDNLTSAALVAPVCMTAPMPLGLVNGEIVSIDYTAVSGTIGYPYAMGDKWTYNQVGNAEILGDCISETSTTPHTVEVVAADVSVTVPAGTFTDCFEIVDTAEGATGSTTTWWSPTVQNAVKVIESESYAPGVQTQELASYDLK
jgi:hypothetical protein